MDQEIVKKDFTAVLLAAGYGSRISDTTDNPKCLLEINERSLIERNFDIWKNLGIRKVNLVLGYKKEMIIEVASQYKDFFDFNFYTNEDYRNHGNTFSLELGIKDINGPCLIFDADLIYEESILRDFLLDSSENQILVGEASINDIECAKALVDEDNNVKMTIDKRAVTQDELEKYRFVGEAVGILKFSKNYTKKLSEGALTFLSEEKNLNLNWEHLLNVFLMNNSVGQHTLASGHWVEIDNNEDLSIAKRLFNAL